MHKLQEVTASQLVDGTMQSLILWQYESTDSEVSKLEFRYKGRGPENVGMGKLQLQFGAACAANATEIARCLWQPIVVSGSV